jgi:adenine phosphoribosyltransferase
MRMQSIIMTWQDFPKGTGVIFRDVFPILRSAEAIEICISILCSHVRSAFPDGIDAVVGLESRGFIFGPLMAAQLKVGFVPIRKAGKLPGPCAQISYSKEYGKDVFEIAEGSLPKGARVVVIDDLMATGGTFVAGAELCKKVGAVVRECICLIELDDLAGRKKMAAAGFNLWSMLHYSDKK